MRRRGFQGDDGARGTPELPEQPADEDPRGLLHLGDPAQAGDQQEDHREDMEADGQGGDDRHDQWPSHHQSSFAQICI